MSFKFGGDSDRTARPNLFRDELFAPTCHETDVTTETLIEVDKNVNMHHRKVRRLISEGKEPTVFG